MTSKILPFNWALIKKDFKLTSWLCLAMTAILFFNISLGVVLTYSDFQRFLEDVAQEPERYSNFDEKFFKGSAITALADIFAQPREGPELLVLFLGPMVLVALLFAGEKQRKTMEVLFSMPLSRWEIFFNKLLVALANISLPFILNASIMILALGFSPGLRDFYTLNQVFYWLWSDIFRAFAILAFSFIFGVLTGNSISHLVLTIIFLAFPYGFALLIDTNMQLWGYKADVIHKFLDTFGYYTIPVIFADLKHIPMGFKIYHFLSALVLIVLSKIVFDKNRAERSGETLEFRSMEAFFKLGVAGCFSLLFAAIISWSSDGIMGSRLGILLSYVLGGGFGWVIAHYSMRSQESKV